MKKKSGIFLFTGLSGAGKTTLAKAVAARLGAKNRLVVLDGDVLRSGVCSDLGFSEKDRLENLRRSGEIARLLAGQGINVIMAMIAPYEQARMSLLQNNPDNFYIVHVRCPLEICILRDPRKNYQKALGGHIQGYTGLGAPYEQPLNPHLQIDTGQMTIADCVDALCRFMEPRMSPGG